MSQSINITGNKKIESFEINGNKLYFDITEFPLLVNSFPRNYSVSSISSYEEYSNLLKQSDFIIVDENVMRIYPIPFEINSFIYTINATENNKNLNTVLDLIEVLIKKNISKGDKVIAIGGGIIQDISACACALFRRGQPFTYLPTTTLGQLDSCVGAKCAVNTSSAKNILGLFSAPKEVIIPMFSIKTMPQSEHRAGLSEMLRLCITASNNAIDNFQNLLPFILEPEQLDIDKYKKALQLSLSIKKSVVEFDEYEKDVRRSMNYGHTFGHAIEKLSNFNIPHGLAVLLGIQIANKFSLTREFMNIYNFNKISHAVKSTLTNLKSDFSFLKKIDAKDVVEQFKFDKKGDGKSVPLILIKEPGKMIFFRYFFESNSTDIIDAINDSIENFLTWKNL